MVTVEPGLVTKTSNVAELSLLTELGPEANSLRSERNSTAREHIKGWWGRLGDNSRFEPTKSMRTNTTLRVRKRSANSPRGRCLLKTS